MDLAREKLAQVEELGGDAAALEEGIKEKDSEIESLETEKELQAGGEMKEVAAEADELSKAIVKMESDLKSKRDGLKGEEASLKQVRASVEELDDAKFAAREEEARGAREQAAAALEGAVAAVEAAGNELAGAQAGDGRDSSNRSMQERLADAQNAQVCGSDVARAALFVLFSLSLLSSFQLLFPSSCCCCRCRCPLSPPFTSS